MCQVYFSSRLQVIRHHAVGSTLFASKTTMCAHIATQLLDTAVSGVGWSPALATCETRQVLLAVVSGGFPGVLPFRPAYRLARLYE